MTFHIEERVDDLVARGLPKYDARTQAERKFGGYMQHKENTWEIDLLNWLAQSSPTFAMPCAGSRSRRVSRRGRPFAGFGHRRQHGDFHTAQRDHAAIPAGAAPGTVSAGDSGRRSHVLESAVEELRTEKREGESVFAGLFAWNPNRFNTATSGEAQYVEGSFVSGKYFSALGVNAVLGRVISSEDDRPGCPAVAVMPRLMGKAYSGSPAALGKT